MAMAVNPPSVAIGFDFRACIVWQSAWLGDWNKTVSCFYSCEAAPVPNIRKNAEQVVITATVKAFFIGYGRTVVTVLCLPSVRALPISVLVFLLDIEMNIAAHNVLLSFLVLLAIVIDR